MTQEQGSQKWNGVEGLARLVGELERQKGTQIHIWVCNNAEWLREHVAQEVWEVARDVFTDDELRRIVNREIHNALVDLQMREGWWMIVADASGFHDWNGKGHTAHNGIRTYDDIDAAQDASLYGAVCAGIEKAMNIVS